ncbi:MAG: hypothetical protein NTY83_02290 [Candidatus Micrarchaeota archaeon]|nr:hypothetical protein [Candidatus Micrarchaeota archaeon]
MQRAAWGRNFIASASCAFALMAPAVAGCATSPRAPISEVCISPSATAQEARAVVEGAIERMEKLYGILLDRFRKVEWEIAGLGPRAASHRQPLRYVLDLTIPNVEGALLSFKEIIERLEAGAGEAGEDAERMGIVAQRACAARESAEITFENWIGLLDMASAEIRTAVKG